MRRPRLTAAARVCVAPALLALLCAGTLLGVAAGPAGARPGGVGAPATRATTLEIAWIGGDSMAYQIRPTLEARLRALGVGRVPWFCKSSTGLVRTDFFNWPVKARQQMQAFTRRPRSS